MTDKETNRASKEIYQLHVKTAMEESGFDLFCIDHATDILFKAFEEVTKIYGPELGVCALEITYNTFIAAEKACQELQEKEAESE